MAPHWTAAPQPGQMELQATESVSTLHSSTPLTKKKGKKKRKRKKTARSVTELKILPSWREDLDAVTSVPVLPVPGAWDDRDPAGRLGRVGHADRGGVWWVGMLLGW